MESKDDMINYVDMGVRVTQKRNAKGLTQEQLAFTANLSQSTVNKIEKGKNTGGIIIVDKDCQCIRYDYG